VILSYGPAADAGLASTAASVWVDDGVYDWDANGEPYEGSAAVERMLQDDGHQRFIANGAAHFAGPPLIDVDGDRATAVNYSLVMQREGRALLPVARERGALGPRTRRFLVAGSPKDEPPARRLGRRASPVRRRDAITVRRGVRWDD